MTGSSPRRVASGGIGFIGALTIAFIVLRLTESIDWHWAWVLSPLWAPAASIFAVIAGIAMTILVVGVPLEAARGWLRQRRRRKRGAL